jgi:hypothetical protein
MAAGGWYAARKEDSESVAQAQERQARAVDAVDVELAPELVLVLVFELVLILVLELLPALVPEPEMVWVPRIELRGEPEPVP